MIEATFDINTKEYQESISQTQPIFTLTESDIDILVHTEFDKALDNGYTNTKGITMQCRLEDVTMLRSGLTSVLNTPTTMQGAGGNTSFMIEVIDMFNNPHVMTIQEALNLTTEVERYFWSLWLRKNNYRKNLKSLLGKPNLTMDDVNAVSF